MNKDFDINNVNNIGKGLTSIAEKCKNDAQYRESIMQDGWKLLEDAGMASNFPSRQVKIDVRQNTNNDFFFILPPDPNSVLSDESLMAVNAAKKAAGCASTAACAATASSAFSCISSASSAGTAGSSS